MRAEDDRRPELPPIDGMGLPEKSPLGMMIALRDELKDKLLRNVSEFRIYLALEEAIRSIEEGGPTADRPQRIRSLRVMARQLLNERAKPQSTGELAEGLRALGAPTSENSISSSLSQSPDFVSVRWGGRPRWWLANLPTPPEP